MPKTHTTYHGVSGDLATGSAALVGAGLEAECVSGPGEQAGDHVTPGALGLGGRVHQQPVVVEAVLHDLTWGDGEGIGYGKGEEKAILILSCGSCS
jgi:hypothetical protein